MKGLNLKYLSLFIFVNFWLYYEFEFIIINMIQRIIILIFIYAIMPISTVCLRTGYCNAFFVQKVYARDSLKINSINFDNSDSIIFLGTSGSEDVADINITKKTLTDPDRVFFDIENAIITFPNSTYELKNSRLTKLRIAQNSTAPDIVRIVINNSPDYNISQIKVLKIKNNIIIKLSNETPLQQYLTQTYKETKGTSVEYYDKAVVIREENEKKESDEIFDKVQQAFKNDDNQLVRPNIEQKQARLKSRFFLEKIGVNGGNILISGIGVINIEKPFVLTEPDRIVFDLPNTIVLQELRDKEFKLSEFETVKIGQFEPSKARIVIKTRTPEAYIPVYSDSLQTLLIANTNKFPSALLAEEKTELTYFKEEKINSNTDVLNIMFSKPVIYSIKRENNTLNVVLYNMASFDVDAFNAVAVKNKTGYSVKRISAYTYMLSMTVPASYVDCYETLNASQLRFVFTGKLQAVQPSSIPSGIETKTSSSDVSKQTQIPTQTPVRKPETKTETKKEIYLPEIFQKDKKQPSKIIKKQTKEEKTAIKKIKNKVIVIDPGHGGNDTGAMRGQTLEKDLTLSIALKVRNALREEGLKNIVMTRETDTTLTLAERVETANSQKADIYVSIHINASVKNEINGIETHYYTDRGYEVAKIIHKELMDKIEAEDRGLFKSKFYVINHTEAPSVLLELGFISNERERSQLSSEKRQTESAEAIAEGIINYLMEH